MAIGLPIQYQRLNPTPLETDRVFESMELALTYVKGPTCYSGDVISVKINGDYESYIVTIAKELKPISENGFILVDSLPPVGEEEKLYVIKATGELYMYSNKNWIQCVRSFTLSLSDEDASNDDKVPTAKAVKDYVKSKYHSEITIIK